MHECNCLAKANPQYLKAKLYENLVDIKSVVSYNIFCVKLLCLTSSISEIQSYFADRLGATKRPTEAY